MHVGPCGRVLGEIGTHEKSRHEFISKRNSWLNGEAEASNMRTHYPER